MNRYLRAWYAKPKYVQVELLTSTGLLFISLIGLLVWLGVVYG